MHQFQSSGVTWISTDGPFRQATSDAAKHSSISAQRLSLESKAALPACKEGRKLTLLQLGIELHSLLSYQVNTNPAFTKNSTKALVHCTTGRAASQKYHIWIGDVADRNWDVELMKYACDRKQWCSTQEN